MFTREEFKALTFDQKKEVMEWRAKFHEKKAKATAEVTRIKKNGYNSFHKYHYASESDVKEGIRPVLHDNGLSITNDLIKRVETGVSTKNGAATKTDMQMLFTITDVETGYFEEYTMDGVAIDNGDKGIYKCYSSTIKYFLLDMFLIPTGDEVETDSPELAGSNPQNNGSQGRANQSGGNQSSGQEKPQGQSQGVKWQTILDKEKELAAISGKTPNDVRAMMKQNLGEIGMYKEMDQKRIGEVLSYLDGCIEYFKTPQA